jgi:hypothetical protein
LKAAWQPEDKNTDRVDGPLPKGDTTAVSRMKRKRQTQVGQKIYAMRKVIVEPVFGQIRQARVFRQFFLRGLENVQMDWALVCLTNNFLTLHPIIATNHDKGRKPCSENAARSKRRSCDAADGHRLHKCHAWVKPRLQEN